jgi:hypothetical protein
MPTASSQKPKWSMIILIAGISLQVGWYWLMFDQALHQEDYLRKLDFISFYTAGRIARVGDWTRVYDMQREFESQSSIANRPLPMDEFLPYNHPPFLLPFQAWTAVDDYSQAFIYWILIRFLFILIAGFWIFRMVRRLGWDRLASWFFTIECILFYPLFIGLIKGQDTSLALLGLVVCLSGLVRSNDMESGLGLSLLLIRPQLALPLSIPFIFKRRKIWWWFLAGAVLLGLYSFLMVGWRGARDLLNQLVISANGETVAIHSFAMYNLKGMLIRSFPALETTVIPVITWAAYLLTIVILCVWWARSSEIHPRQFGLAVILVLFVSPHLHHHDLALLLIPIIVLCIELVRLNKLTSLGATALLMGITYYMAIILLTPINYSGSYLMMILLAGALWVVGKNPMIPLPVKEKE